MIMTMKRKLSRVASSFNDLIAGLRTGRPRPLPKMEVNEEEPSITPAGVVVILEYYLYSMVMW